MASFFFSFYKIRTSFFCSYLGSGITYINTLGGCDSGWQDVRRFSGLYSCQENQEVSLSLCIPEMLQRCSKIQMILSAHISSLQFFVFSCLLVSIPSRIVEVLPSTSVLRRKQNSQSSLAAKCKTWLSFAPCTIRRWLSGTFLPRCLSPSSSSSLPTSCCPVCRRCHLQWEGWELYSRGWQRWSGIRNPGIFCCRASFLSGLYANNWIPS